MTSIAVDILLCVLLVVTIGYSSVLNRRLKRLRNEEDIMRATVQEMVNTSALADKALRDLRAMAESTDASLHSRIVEAEKLAKYLAGFTASRQGSNEQAAAANQVTAATPAVQEQAGISPHVHPEQVRQASPHTRSNSPIFDNLRASAQRLSSRAPQ